MAINDDLKTPNRNRLTDTRDGMGMLPIIIGVLAVMALGWWIFGDRLMTNNHTARTSTPVTGSPTSGAPTNTNTSNPGTSKQP